MKAVALFYPVEMTLMELQLVVAGVAEQPAIDTIAFDAETGGDQQRQLALPYLPGMDEIVLDEAELAFRVGNRTMDVTFAPLPVPGNMGVRFSIDHPARLRKIEISHAPVQVPNEEVRLVVRPVTGGDVGPPMLAHPHFGPPGDMFPPLLAGLTVAPLGNSRYMLTLPDLLGTSWQLQFATGRAVTELKPLPVAPTIHRVSVAAAPRNLSLTLEGTPPTPLWANADVLMPDSGEQTVSFLPLAQRRMSDALAARAEGALTLPLDLTFHSDSGATLEVTRRRLSGEYRVRPLGDSPATVKLGGRPSPLELNAPAAVRPTRGATTLTARMLGRTLNAGSGSISQPAAGGLRAGIARSIAARLPIAAREANAAGPVPLASVAIRLAVPEASELALELRADAAGRPGSAAAAPIVRQFDAGFDDWAEFVLPTPLEVPAGTSLWVSIRLTKGTAHWYARAAGTAPEGLGEACVSVDRGASWGEASALLGASAGLLVQGFHSEDPPFRRPEIRFEHNGALLPADWFAGAVADSPTQFSLADAAFPPQILERIAAAPPVPGQARAPTRILLYSTSVLDLVLTGTVLGYDPLAA